MITLFNSESIYIGTDMKKFNEIRDYLDQHQIKYKYKVKNQLAQWDTQGTVRGRTGSLGNPPEQMYEYEIMVHKNDAKRVRLDSGLGE